MTLGSSALWLNSLIDVDHEMIKCIATVWPSVIARLTTQEREDNITERLVDCLRKDRSVCALGFLSLHFKLRNEDMHGDFTTKGILDMALFLNQDHENYIAYECKRLNLVNDKGKRTGSLAGPYVEEGIVRYSTAKYSEKLPYGCMLGYVMDGDTTFAFKQLKEAIVKRKSLIGLESEKILGTTSTFFSFETAHRRKRNNTLISVRHRLLSMTA